jgi:hypothetical protein
MHIRLLDYAFFIISKHRNPLKLTFELIKIKYFESGLDLDSIGSMDLDPGRPNGLKQRKKFRNFMHFEKLYGRRGLFTEPERSHMKNASFCSNFFPTSILTLVQIRMISRLSKAGIRIRIQQNTWIRTRIQ